MLPHLLELSFNCALPAVNQLLVTSLWRLAQDT